MRCGPPRRPGRDAAALGGTVLRRAQPAAVHDAHDRRQARRVRRPVRRLLLSCLEVRAGQRSAEVPGGQPVFAGKPPEPFRGHLKPSRAQLRVMLPAILQRHFEVLAPIEQGLRHREVVVELPDRPGTDGVAQPQHVRPGIEPDPAARHEIVTLIGFVTRLHLVVKQFQAHLVRPPAPPERDQADPCPVSVPAMKPEPFADDFLDRQRPLAQLRQLLPVRGHAEAAELREQVLLAHAGGVRPQRPRVLLQLAADGLIAEGFLRYDPVEGDPGQLHAGQRGKPASSRRLCKPRLAGYWARRSSTRFLNAAVSTSPWRPASARKSRSRATAWSYSLVFLVAIMSSTCFHAASPMAAMSSRRLAYAAALAAALRACASRRRCSSAFSRSSARVFAAPSSSAAVRPGLE